MTNPTSQLRSKTNQGQNNKNKHNANRLPNMSPLLTSPPLEGNWPLMSLRCPPPKKKTNKKRRNNKGTPKKCKASLPLHEGHLPLGLCRVETRLGVSARVRHQRQHPRGVAQHAAAWASVRPFVWEGRSDPSEGRRLKKRAVKKLCVRPRL